MGDKRRLKFLAPPPAAPLKSACYHLSTEEIRAPEGGLEIFSEIGATWRRDGDIPRHRPYGWPDRPETIYIGSALPSKG